MATTTATHSAHSAHSAPHGAGHHADHDAPAISDPNSPFYISHPGPAVYWITFAALMILLGATVGAYFIDLNHLTGWSWPNIIVAMTIAIIKAGLVVTFFMNVKGSTKLTLLWAVLGFIWLILLAGIFVDYQTRAWVDQSGWQQQVGEIAESNKPTNAVTIDKPRKATTQDTTHE